MEIENPTEIQDLDQKAQQQNLIENQKKFITLLLRTVQDKLRQCDINRLLKQLAEIKKECNVDDIELLLIQWKPRSQQARRVEEEKKQVPPPVLQRMNTAPPEVPQLSISSLSRPPLMTQPPTLSQSPVLPPPRLSEPSRPTSTPITGELQCMKCARMISNDEKYDEVQWVDNCIICTQCAVESFATRRRKCPKWDRMYSDQEMEIIQVLQMSMGNDLPQPQPSQPQLESHGIQQGLVQPPMFIPPPTLPVSLTTPHLPRRPRTMSSADSIPHQPQRPASLGPKSLYPQPPVVGNTTQLPKKLCQRCLMVKEEVVIKVWNAECKACQTCIQKEKPGIKRPCFICLRAESLV